MSRHSCTMILCLLTGASFPVAVGAQEAPAGTGTILGTVVDAGTDAGVPGVSVRLLEPVDALVVTGGKGEFVFPSVPQGVQELEVTHIAYGTRRQLVNVPSSRTVVVRVELVQEAIDVGAIRVEVELRNAALEEAGFYSRRKLGFGRFFEQEDLERRTLTGVFREVPRLRLVGGGLSYTPVFLRAMGSCVPAIWVDRRPIRLAGAAFTDLVDRHNIEAMEVFRPGNTPGEFMRLGRDCGAIVIWTRAMSRG